MRRLAALLPLSLLAVPAVAHGAAVQTDRTCYLQTDKTNVTVSGNGYAPNQPYNVLLDNTALTGGLGTMDAGGAMQGAFAPPMLADDELERKFDVAVSSSGIAAAATFTVTRLQANFTPSEGDPTKLKVRFSVAGFGLATHNPDVYVHYIAPGGKLKQTVRLGQATGQCGRIAKTAKRKLFPFTRPALGKWQLQFDTTKTFTEGDKQSKFLFYSVGVCLQPPGAPKPSTKSPCPQKVKK
ncbi:hypothetical protein DSM104299_00367 [Baekduia alba]|uniref:hypothetical protein n=1 Tax=Baekduia alba TaxID=2997333 RepID=UPI0023427C73|nr:hypothetical protein [Baekduia alba]WCB91694.1 hypothetical protein DSM104299_00367 [Baekduia alba]